MRPPFPRLLPLVLGLVSVGLMIGDVLAWRSCASCDTGLPMWPHRLPLVLLSALNAPALVLARPLLALPYLYGELDPHLVRLPLILLWWWWVGTRLDANVLVFPSRRFPALQRVALLTAMIVLLAIAALGIADLRFQPSVYGPRHPLLLFQNTAILLWTFALAAASAGAFRSLRAAAGAVRDYPNTQSVLVRGFLLTALLAVTLSLSGYARQPRVDRDTCVATSDSGCLHGTVLDTSGHPLRGLRVQALPFARTGDARWLATKSDWTDHQGRYQITGVDPGQYLIAVHYYDAPHQHQPFPTTFYPGIEAEDLAARLPVVAHSPTLLDPLRLRRLPTATVTVRVRWADGTQPQKSNLLFHNIHYPNQAVIGDVAPQIHDGIGEFTLPVGYTYSASASVTCDAGSMIEQRQSPPVRHVQPADSPLPSALTFTIPGAPCPLWSPPQESRPPFPTLPKILTGLFSRF